MFGLEAWHAWIIVGLLLVLAELLGAGFVLLALGVACLIGAAVAGATDLGFGWQLGLTSAAAALLVPSFVYWFRRSFIPHRGVVGEGGGQGERARLIKHGDRIGLKHKGDFFPARAIDGKPLRAGDQVEIQSFEGITALVAPCPD